MERTGLKVSWGFVLFSLEVRVASRKQRSQFVLVARQFPCQWIVLVLVLLLDASYSGAEGKGGHASSLG